MKSSDIYKGIPLDKIPWNKEATPSILMDAITGRLKPPAQILDLGCGLGKYTAHFAEKGYQVQGIDISSTAIRHAKQLFADKNLKGNFYVADLCEKLPIVDLKADFAYDFEVLHHIYPDCRPAYLQNVQQVLKSKAYYLSICFSENDKNFGGKGKYRDTPIGTCLYFSSIQEISELMREYFCILDVNEIELAGNPIPHKAIYCLTQKL